MNKIAIAMDILRQYNENLEVSGKETKIYAIDGYGERVSFKALVYGYWYVFSSIYGSSTAWYGYPKDMYWNMIWGEGIIGWNRPVTNPTVDIPKALTIYTQLASSAASYKDKFTRETAFKKLFYRDGTYAHNVFIDAAISEDDDGYIQTAGTILQKEDPDFYEYVNNKLYDLWDLAFNEAKNVSVPIRLKFLFDSRPVAKMYDASPEDESYKDGLLNMNSSVIQANQFYLTFLTSFEQIIYQYTKQTFPIKLFGTLANLYSSYVKLITNYVKPYHARLIDKAPILRFGGDLEESVAVGDIMRLDPTVQIFTDVVRWRFDNPYDYRPDEYDKLDKIWDEFWLGGKPSDEEEPTDPWDWEGIIYYEDAPEYGIVQVVNDVEHYYHRIDDELLYTDNKLNQNDIYEDISITEDIIHTNIRPSLDEIPFNLYPSSLYNQYSPIWTKYEEEPDIIMDMVKNIVNTNTPAKVEVEKLPDKSYLNYKVSYKYKPEDSATEKTVYRYSYDEIMSVEEATRIVSNYNNNLKYKLTLNNNDLIEYDWLAGYIENISDRDLCIITDLYNDKDEYRIKDIKFNLKTLDDIDVSGSKIGMFTDDLTHLWTFNEHVILDKDYNPHTEWLWKLTKIPVVSDIFNRIDSPNSLHDIMILQDSRNNPITYHPVSVSPCMYLSDNETFCKYSTDLPYSDILEHCDDGSIKLPFIRDEKIVSSKDYIEYIPSQYMETDPTNTNTLIKNTYYKETEVPSKNTTNTRNFRFIKFFLYIPAHSKAVLPEIDYTGRKKFR